MALEKMSQNPQPQVDPPLEEGDVLPDIILPNSHARLVQFSTHVSDCRQVLLFCPDPRLAACRRKLKNIAAQFERLKDLAMLFGITNTNPEETRLFWHKSPYLSPSYPISSAKSPRGWE